MSLVSKPLRYCHAIVFCSVLLLFGCSTPSSDRLNEPAGTPRFEMLTLGLCEDYPEESRTLANARRDLLLVKTNGFSVLRIAFGWDAMEPQQGVYDWSFWDEYVAMADAMGVRLIPYICYTPQWAARNPDEQFWTQPPRDVKDFAAFLSVLVSRYGDQIDSWEIWNEPDNRAYWSGTPEEFAELLVVGSRAIRNADPGAQVVSGGLAWDLQFLKEVFEQPGAASAVDVVNLHNYFETWAQEGVEEVDEYVFRADEILREANIDTPLWMAEIGYSNFRTNSIISEAYTATYEYEHTPEFQAGTIFRMLTPLLFPKKVSLIAWYRINDLPSGQEVIGDVNNRYLGVLDEKGRPKPALKALRFFSSLFGKGFIPANDAVRMSTTLQSEVESYAFQNADGELVVVAWLKVVTPQTLPTTHEPLQDSRREKVELLLPESFANRGRLYDARGELLAELEASERAVGFQIRGGEVAIIVMEPSL